MVPWIPEDAQPTLFPPVETALLDPNGLLAGGGDLSPARLVAAYGRGIFPWFSEGDPILWWSPDPRMLLLPSEFRVNRSFKKILRQAPYRLSVDEAFTRVIDACAGPRSSQDGTWISADMRASYVELHAMGHSHSVECWRGDELVGGLYGMVLGKVFCGESMFSHVPNASKIALAALCELGFELIDGQVESPFLKQMGFAPRSRAQFISWLRRWSILKGPFVVK